MKYKKTIGYKDARVLLSDILPYEVPPFFSNRKFYDFITLNNIETEDNTLKFKKNLKEEIIEVIMLLFGFNHKSTEVDKSNPRYDALKFQEKQNQTIPFDFKISHKDNDFRNLYVIHPLNQLEMVEFYKKYNSTMLYYTSISNFSLRKPTKIATLRYFKNKVDSKPKKAEEFIELDKKEYRSLKTYFSYKEYSNIYKYYESVDFQKAEKKFNYLVKFDISRCFDSIYTHSITWATINKSAVKYNLSTKTTFGHDFDTLMQRHNYNETNGIIIGPEFSRIFSEIILQKIDHTVERILEKEGQINGVNYMVSRYVDDYFIFFNDQKIKEKILAVFKKELQKYNLYFNESKTIEYSKPIITEISVAKEQIKALLNNSSIFHFSKPTESGMKYYLAKDIITNYKSILKTTKTSYKDLQNYFLASIYRNLVKLFKDISSDQNKLIKIYKKLKIAQSDQISDLKIEELEIASGLKKKHSSLTKKLKEIIELSFFIYTVLPRVSYAIKLSQILVTIIDFIKSSETVANNLKAKGFFIPNSSSLFSHDFDTKHMIYKRIFDGILIVLDKKINNDYSEIETLYILPIIESLGEEYSVGEDILSRHFLSEQTPNYFTITFLLNYFKGKKEYTAMISELQSIICQRLESYSSKNTEQVFLLFEVLTNPYFGHTPIDLEKFRRKVLIQIDYFKSNTSKEDKLNFITRVANLKNMYFFDWKNPNFGKELNTKRGHEVY